MHESSHAQVVARPILLDQWEGFLTSAGGAAVARAAFADWLAFGGAAGTASV